MSSVLRVEGGHPLRGEITVRGAKNFVPKAMVASLLADTPSELYNVPLIRDVDVVSDLLGLHGVTADFDQDRGTMMLDPTNVKIASRSDIDTLAGASRIPILFCGPLLHQLGEAFIPELGGCAIGGRPIDFHLDTLRKFGAVVDKRPDGVRIRRPASGLHGAIISVDTDRTIRIEGVGKLRGYRHTALPDRIEAASWAAAALATHGDIYVRGALQPDMTTFLNTFRKVGGAFDIDADGIRFYHPGERLHSIALETAVHPGFMTDWQQPLVVALTQADGLSIVHETVYENRFGFASALRQMGATIQVYRECLGGTPCRFGQRNFFHSAVISGPTPLHAADIEVPDLRGGFSHLIAALAARGTSTVSGIDVISRGYEHFTRKLHQLDARVSYVD